MQFVEMVDLSIKSCDHEQCGGTFTVQAVCQSATSNRGGNTAPRIGVVPPAKKGWLIWEMDLGCLSVWSCMQGLEILFCLRL